MIMSGPIAVVSLTWRPSLPKRGFSFGEQLQWTSTDNGIHCFSLGLTTSLTSAIVRQAESSVCD